MNQKGSYCISYSPFCFASELINKKRLSKSWIFYEESLVYSAPRLLYKSQIGSVREYVCLAWVEATQTHLSLSDSKRLSCSDIPKIETDILQYRTHVEGLNVAQVPVGLLTTPTSFKQQRRRGEDIKPWDRSSALKLWRFLSGKRHSIKGALHINDVRCRMIYVTKNVLLLYPKYLNLNPIWILWIWEIEKFSRYLQLK